MSEITISYWNCNNCGRGNDSGLDSCGFCGRGRKCGCPEPTGTCTCGKGPTCKLCDRCASCGRRDLGLPADIEHTRFGAHKPTPEELEWLFAEDDAVTWVLGDPEGKVEVEIMGDKEDLEKYQLEAQREVDSWPDLKIAAYYNYMRNSGKMDLDKSQKLLDKARL